MADKEVRIACPCCQTELRVDLLTGKVTGWLQAGDSASSAALDPESRWAALHDRVKGRVAGAEDKLEQALGKEREREGSLDDGFDRAARKAKRKPGDPV
jgi:hypothetical protein